MDPGITGLETVSKGSGLGQQVHATVCKGHESTLRSQDVMNLGQDALLNRSGKSSPGQPGDDDIDSIDTSVVQQLNQVVSIALDDLQVFKLVAQSYEKYRVLLDHQELRFRGDAQQDLGGEGTCARTQFDHRGGSLQRDAVEHPGSQYSTAGSHSPYRSWIGDVFPEEVDLCAHRESASFIRDPEIHYSPSGNRITRVPLSALDFK